MSTRSNDLPPKERDSVQEEVVDLIPALRAFARTFCRNGSDADDLVQETLTKALANVERFRRGTRLKSWLFTIMRNTFNTRYKIETREPPGFKDCVSADVQCDPTQEWCFRGRELLTAIDRLPMHYRDVVVHVAMGESYIATAEMCDCAVGTVKSRLYRARQLLARDLGEDDDEPWKTGSG
ncbi:sigma-70 family RNA polymerase sigma factor [Hoeflea sp. YIM 152468]|uniref:sigma-70 family RNA polymerase sigma factor n=1 Tax=Hoeflea sp. YIM 152468 TaxID=3031759 RepID=UPI0023DB0E2C|nr:sigma-70 family RNA polymerase sigma factor [Hoeflea sp. YIM 152468]MDF1609367.1 sigma-70 family RNA polymerase sigma factor [Hoeflea sp. YIM 152468]